MFGIVKQAADSGGEYTVLAGSCANFTDRVSGWNPQDVLILHCGFDQDLDNWFLDKIRARGVSADVALRPLPLRALRGLRRLHLLSNVPCKQIWFERWNRLDPRRRLVVVHASDLTIPVAERAARCFPSARVVFWYWNPAGKGTDPNKSRAKGFERWSFEQRDCDKFGMRFNTQFMFSEVGLIGKRVVPDVDFFFFGADKGRSGELVRLASAAEELGFTHRFRVVRDVTSPGGQRDQRLEWCSPAPYGVVLEEAARGRVVVDFVQHGQSGMTLRVLEALFLGRKLLTNNVDIIDSPVYDRKRVFVWGVDDIRELPAFLRTTVDLPARELLQCYDFGGWLDRFRVVGTTAEEV